MRRSLLLVAALIVGVPAGTVAAWSPAGHMVTGAMVYRLQAQSDPAALRQVVALLRRHPLVTPLLVADDDARMREQQAEAALLMRAARWADDVRVGPWDEYSEPTWHYVNFRFLPPRLDPPRSPERDGYLLWALDENLRRLESDSPHVRAVALTWMFHLLGDMHMPLHDIALVDAERPDGDRGGNLTWVRTAPGAETVNLHRLWDGMIIEGDDLGAAAERGGALLSRYGDEARSRLDADTGPAEFRAWAEEAARLAMRQAYLDGRVGAGTEGAGFLLPDDYLARARPIAELQAVLAAQRLARLLQERF